MNATSPTQQSPRSFGPYRLVRKLGSGGYGTTFLVEREFASGMTKQFALKRLSVQPEDRTSRQAEFRDEARLLMLIDKHPGIVQLVDYFPEDDEHVLVMEYVHGVDLQALLNQLRSQHPARRLPHFVSMYITAEICSALAHAHGLPQQVVHRDIAPANVFLGFDGHVKLGDFGIATFIGRPKHTSTTEVKGRLSYMSPEHIDKSLGLDARSDLFSLGGMLYLLLSGHLPFPGTPSEAMPAILKGRITPISTHVPDIDPALAELVHELLCADKALRPSDALNVRARLLTIMSRPDGRDALAGHVQHCIPPDVADAHPSASSLDPAEPTSLSGELYVPPSGEVSSGASRSTRYVPSPLPTLSTPRAGRVTPPSNTPPPTPLPRERSAASDTLAIPSNVPPPMTRRPQPAATQNRNRALAAAGVLLTAVLTALATMAVVRRSEQPPSESKPREQPIATSPAVTPPPAPINAASPTLTTPAAPQALAVPTGIPNGTPEPQPSASDAQRPVKESSGRSPTRPATLSLVVHNYGYVVVDGKGPYQSPVRELRLQPGTHKLRVYKDESLSTEVERLEVTLAPGESRSLDVHATDNLAPRKPQPPQPLL